MILTKRKNRAGRILLIVISVLLAVILLSTTAFYIIVQRTFTPDDGTIQLKGIKESVEIYRDSWGVPHIYANNKEDLFFAQGYVHAQDRLWQLDLYRRLGSGTLSEILGETPLDIDRFMRTIGIRQTAEKQVADMDTDLRLMLESYTAGVNSFIRQYSDRLPLEFIILGYKPAEWQPVDSMTVANIIAWELGKNWKVELLRGRLVQKFGLEKANQILPLYPDDSPLVIDNELLAHPLGNPEVANIPGGIDGIGSNNWVVDGSKSVSGKPLLSNDPHLEVQLPSIWYEIGLHGGGFNVTGVSLPGCPLVIIGRNDNISWGITNLPADVQDLYIEKINPSNPHLYEYNGVWETMTVRQEKITIRGHSQPEMLEIKITRHGPLLNNAVKGLEEPLALQWAGANPGQMLRSAYLLDRAKNWLEFRDSLQYWDCPGQNFVYADGEGNIGYQTTGKIPIRSKGQGSVPVPGWNGEYDWIGYIPYKEMPFVLNPATHFIATANNKVVSSSYPYSITCDWSPQWRAQRINTLLTEKDKLSPEDFKNIQADVYNLPAAFFTPYLLELSPDNATEKTALEIMKTWDFRDEIDKPAPAIFHSFYVRLLKNTFKDDLGDKWFEDYVRAQGGSGDVHTVALTSIFTDPNNSWFDDIKTTAKETRIDIIKKSFSEAINDLCRVCGSNPNTWKWGNLHKTPFNHPLGAVKPLNLIFNIGAVPTPGSRYTVDVSGYDPNKPFEVIIISSYRQIIDWGDPDNAIAMHTTGQSGLPFHPHYKDMVPQWLAVNYHQMLFNREDVLAAKQSLLILKP